MISHNLSRFWRDRNIKNIRPMKEKLPLNEQDINKIRNHLIPILVFPFLVVGLFYGFYCLFWSDSQFLQDKTGQYMLIGFSVFFFGIIAYMISTTVIDLRWGFKHRITGKITDKKLDVRTSTTHSSNGKTGSSSTTTSRYYYVDIDGVRYSIESQHFGKLKVGNEVTMEKAPKSNVTLLLEVRENDELPPEKSAEADNDKRSFLSSTPKNIPFNQNDFKALKKGFMAKAKLRLIWFLPPMLIALSLVVNGMQAFLVFLFPLVLIPGYQLWKFSREFRQYNSNKQYAYKAGIPAIVQDKSKYAYNGKGSNNVSTSQGTIKVKDELYAKLTVGDKIILYKLAKGKQVLSVLTADKEEVYLL